MGVQGPVKCGLVLLGLGTVVQGPVKCGLVLLGFGKARMCMMTSRYCTVVLCRVWCCIGAAQSRSVLSRVGKE